MYTPPLSTVTVKQSQRSAKYGWLGRNRVFRLGLKLLLRILRNFKMNYGLQILSSDLLVTIVKTRAEYVQI